MSFTAVLHRIERIYERVRNRQLDPEELAIECYTGYGNRDVVRLRGRVVKFRLPRETSADDSRRRNFLNVASRFFTKEAAHTDIEVVWNGSTHLTQTDEEGHFKIEVPLGDPKPHTPHHTFTASVVGTEKSFTGRVQLETEKTRRIVISDIDDTVIETGAQRLWQMLKTTLFSNEHTRAVFPGVAEFYRQLISGRNNDEENPIYYISSSPWNLRSFLRGLFDLHEIPDGAAFLTDWGLDKETLFKAGHGKHKLAAIREVLALHPHLPAVLIGDSGEKDPEIYSEIAAEFPDRISVIYIRDVSPEERDQSVGELAITCAKHGVTLQLIKTTDEAVADAKEREIA